ncbi:AraC family transcriptional regulator [Paenibacillus kobensis]|uniref:AraC family transcriptional regulator n=1 Tax=Paenibacillus kobensis TaxID=59841 RepID=UPI000FD72DE4|nr:AraC family transcriptional regulator [Paenibacillus kobensis]
MQVQLKLPQLEVHRIINTFENVPHSHESDYQLTIPTHGTCHFSYENKQVALSPGEGMLLHPSGRHSFHMSEQSGVIIVIVKDKQLQPIVGGRQDEEAMRRRIEPSVISGHFRRWMSAAAEFNLFDSLAAEEAEMQVLSDLKGMLAEPTGQLVRNGAAVGAGTGARAGGSTDDEAVWRGMPVCADPHIARALDYVHTHYTEQLSVDTMAAVALQSRYHFIRSFKSAVGRSPYQYVLLLRIMEAKRQLRRTAATVTEISYRLGFSSTSQFYRAFERMVGATPEQYRKDR